jgi:hypothetical protein
MNAGSKGRRVIKFHICNTERYTYPYAHLELIISLPINTAPVSVTSFLICL